MALQSAFDTLSNAADAIAQPVAQTANPTASSPQDLGLNTQDSALLFPAGILNPPGLTTDDYWDTMTGHHADFVDNATNNTKREDLMNFLAGNNLGAQEGYDAIKAAEQQPSVPQDTTHNTQDIFTASPSPGLNTQDSALPSGSVLPPSSLLFPPTTGAQGTIPSPGLDAQDSGLRDTTHNTQDTSYSALASQVQQTLSNPPQFPTYQLPQLNWEQGALGALGAILDKRHAAQNVQGLAQGNTQYAQSLYQKQLQQYQAAEAQHQEQLKNLLTLAGMQSGRDEASARVQAELVARQMQIQATEAWRNAGIQERIQNDLESRYNNATGLNEKLQLGHKLGLPDDAIQADWGQQQQKQQLAAVSEWNRQLAQFEGRYGADPQDAQRLKDLKSQFAQQFGVPESTLRDPFTAQTLQQQRDQTRQQNWSQTFDLGKDKFALQKLRQFNAFDALRQRIEQAQENYNAQADEIGKRMELRNYNALAQQWRALHPEEFNAEIDKRADALQTQIQQLGSSKAGLTTPARLTDINSQIVRLQGEFNFWQNQKVNDQYAPIDIPMPTVQTMQQQQPQASINIQMPNGKSFAPVNPLAGPLTPHGSKLSPPVGPSGDRPQGMSDSQIIQLARASVASGASRQTVQARLDKWGVHGSW